MAAERSNIHLMDFVPEADLLIERAERVVAMAGYNTVCSLLSFGKKALLVPRVYPRSEQLIRAERLQQLGFVDMLTPTELTIENMRRWILQDYQQPRCVRGAIDFKGLATLTGLTRDLVEHRATAKSPISLPATA
jgi:predicted glycosyltransferase